MLQIVLEIIVNNFLFVMQGRLMFLYHLIFHIFIGDKTMADKLMYIPNNDTQNYFFSRLQLVVETFGHLT